MTTPSYTAPDMSIIRDSREAIRYQAIIGSADLYLEALRNELIKLNTNITETDLIASGTLTSALISLDTTALSETLEALITLAAGEVNEQTKSAIDSYTKIARQLISLCTDNLDEEQTKLSNAIYSVRYSPISNNRFKIAELMEARALLATELAKEKPPVDKLLEDEKVLNEAINLFEKLTIIDRLKPLLEQLVGMIGGQPDTPQTAVMKAGLVVANKFLDEANELIKYQDLIKARTTLRVRLKDRQARLDSLVTQMSDNDKKVKQLNDTKKVIEPRDSYADETSKIVDALSLFLEAIGDNDVIKKGQKLIEQAKPFARFLQNLKGQWQRG
ncbi:alpha-xenorhabdolysin family binary toxin subunit B [Pseudomonas sp.]|uniref:alpha-xenorhabdolysin family binary toxin subunit B n=1 Tax=Pseudomonas sp. TaxID=306 RepID=UPI003F3F321E